MASDSPSQNSHAQATYRKRVEHIDALARPDSMEVFDLCIVGGGITGAAIARDAATRGLKTLLVEKGDFAEGTSSRSSKLVHGGVRYLEQMEFGLVMESTRERALLWKLAPQLVKPLAFLFPAYKHSRVPLWKLSLGLWLYDILAAFRTPSLHRTFLKNRLLQEEPGLNPEELVGAQFYWDAATDDSLITLANILDAESMGATTLSRVEAIQIDERDSTKGEAHLIHLKDHVGDRVFQVRARTVLFATGPWTDRTLSKLLAQRRYPEMMQTTRGSHIVVSQDVLPCKHAVVMTHPEDGRVLFAIPWSDFSVIGTTDLFDKEAPEKTGITSEEVQYLIDSTAYYFPNNPIKQEDIISTWSGLRPLVAPPGEAGASEISRDHFLDWADNGFAIMTGGKLTTHREMAEQAIDLILKECASWPTPLSVSFSSSPTGERPLPILSWVSDGNPRAEIVGDSEASRISNDDVLNILREQHCLSLEDFSVRRTQIFYKESDNGLGVLEHFKDVFMSELGWDEEQWELQWQSYLRYLEKNVYQPLGRKT